MGYKECVWCQDYAKYLNEAIIDSDVEEIYYLDIYKDRKKKSKEYEKIVKIISDRLPYDEEGNHQILVPSTVFVSSGIVINYDDETSYVNSSMNDKKAYWTDNNIKSFKEKINNYSKNIEVDSVCKENSGC